MDTLRNLGVEARVDRERPKDRHVDYTATLRRGAKRAPFQIEAKRALRPGTLGPVLLRLQGLKPPALLLADYVTPRMAKLLRNAGIAFADTAGNAYLEFGGNILYVKATLLSSDHVPSRSFEHFRRPGFELYSCCCARLSSSLDRHES